MYIYIYTYIYIYNLCVINQINIITQIKTFSYILTTLQNYKIIIKIKSQFASLCIAILYDNDVRLFGIIIYVKMKRGFYCT